MARAAGRIIVTGGAGLIGSALVWQLNRDGYDDALVVDRLGRSEKWSHLVPLRFAEYLEAEEFFPRIAEHPDAFGPIAAVYHLGACSATTERDATYLIENNYRRTQDDRPLGARPRARGSSTRRRRRRTVRAKPICAKTSTRTPRRRSTCTATRSTSSICGRAARAFSTASSG